MNIGAMEGAAISAAGIGRRYGERRALDDFSLEVPGGSVFGLLGPNGSGKSTFVGLVAAMEAPDSGTLRVFGEPPAPALRARVGTVFQENASDPLMTVNDTLWLASRLFGVPRAQARERSASLLAAFGLSDRASDAVSTLSGGMRRRLEMARALLHDPSLLLLDEPTTGVDPHERRALWAALMDTRGAGRTILLATNDLAEADAVCDRVAFVQAGKVMATGTPADLKRGLRREAVRVTVDGLTPGQLSEVEQAAGAGQVVAQDEVLHITVDDASAFVPRLFAIAPGAIRTVTIEQSTLEDSYFQHVARQPAGSVAPL
ncbi:MAG: ABC transporter ATP-binding protein [Chloroflexi bacterium]|nr:ABC transporter ATP-binding protein [Chloroflexota bacterium]